MFGMAEVRGSRFLIVDGKKRVIYIGVIEKEKRIDQRNRQQSYRDFERALEFARIEAFFEIPEGGEE